MAKRKKIIFIFVLLFFLSSPIFSIGADNLVIERAKSLSFDEKNSRIAILNGDDTISIYDVVADKFIISRKKLDAGKVGFIEINPDGKSLVLYSYNRTSITVHIFDLKNVLDSSSPKPAVSYSLPPITSGSVAMNFSDDGKDVFVLAGDRNLYILNTENYLRRVISVGNNPIGVALDGEGKLLVLNEGSEDLSVVDTSKEKVLATIKLGDSPKRVIFNSATGKAYITHVGSDDVYIVDTKNYKVEKIIKVGSDPVSLTYDDKTGAVYIANNSNGSINVIYPDYSTKTIDIKSPAYFTSSPIKLSYSSSEKKLFILNISEKKYFIVDTDQLRIIKEEKLDLLPVDIVNFETAKSVFISYWNANSIFSIKSDILTTRNIPGSPVPVDSFFSKPQSIIGDSDSSRIFVSNMGSDYITVIDGNVQKPVTKIRATQSVQNLFLNSATKKIYAVSPSTNSLTVIDISKSDYPRKTVQLEQQPRGGSINEKTNKIYFSNSAVSKLTVINGSKDEVSAIIELPKGTFPLITTIDDLRNKIYVALYGGDSIAVIDGATDKIEKYISTGRNPIWVRYIPKLDKIFVSVEQDEKVLVINPQTAEIAQSVSFSGKPYRIFFDKETNFVYINRRNDNSVTILDYSESEGKFIKINEEPMRYWGETDARPYNMIYSNDKTNLIYLTSGNGNRVDVVKVGRDSRRILNGIWQATINQNGETIFSGDSRNIPERKILTIRNILIYSGIGVFIVLTGFLIIFFTRKKIYLRG